MRAILLAGLIGLGISSDVKAEIVFFVDAEGISHCSSLARIAEGFAEHRQSGISAAEMREAMLAGEVDPDVADLMIRTIFSFEAKDSQTFYSIFSALCVLDRLQPIEIER